MNAPNLEALNADISREFPSFKVVYKADSALMKVLHVAILIFTFGQAKTFMTEYTTTIGTTTYLPASWDGWTLGNRCTILRHERVHMRQAKKYSFFLFAVAYIFFPLPIGLAWGRAQFEMEAYAETLQAWHDYGVNILQPGYRQDVIDHFTTGQYGWMWPFTKKIEAWYDATAAQVLAEK